MQNIALWRRLDGPGHDAARLLPTGIGWRIEGAATFLHEGAPSALSYSVDADSSWNAVGGFISGFAGSKEIRHEFRRGADGWLFDGRKAEGLQNLPDLDFGFTPATNLQQLRRIALEAGEEASFSVAWFDIGAGALTELPQFYRRQDGTRYWYEAPTFGYSGILEIAGSGFVAVYPELWEMES